MKHRCLLLLCLSAIVVLAAPTGAQERTATQPVLQPANARYLLQPNDVVEIVFRFTPEFDQTVTVQPDGFVNLWNLPDMRVVGKTTPQLAQMLQKAYAPILHDPVVDVRLKEFEKPYFIATGEVGRPGRYDLRGPTTVIQAIAEAGGLNEKSKHSEVLLFRRLSDQWTEVKKLDIKQMLKAGDLKEDVHLRPGDMVFVPKNTISKIQRFIPTPSLGFYVNPF